MPARPIHYQPVSHAYHCLEIKPNPLERRIKQYREVIRKFQELRELRKTVIETEAAKILMTMKLIEQGRYVPQFKNDAEREEYYSLLEQCNYPMPRLDEKQLTEDFYRRISRNLIPEKPAERSETPTCEKSEQRKPKMIIQLSKDRSQERYSVIVNSPEKDIGIIYVSPIAAKPHIETIMRQHEESLEIRINGGDEKTSHLLLKMIGYGKPGIEVSGIPESYLNTYDPSMDIDDYLSGKTTVDKKTEISAEAKKHEEEKRRRNALKTIKRIEELKKMRTMSRLEAAAGYSSIPPGHSMADIVDRHKRRQAERFAKPLEKASKKRF